MSEESKDIKKKKFGYYHHKGEKIKVVFKDGKAVIGTLLWAPPYEIILETEDGKELTIQTRDQVHLCH